MLTKEEMQSWFVSFWTDIKGASTRSGHPAPFPVELAERLIQMFSFASDTVLDPFFGTGSSSVAAVNCGRNSIGNEIDPSYLRIAKGRLEAAMAKLKLVGPVNPKLSCAEDTSEFDEPEFAELSST